MEETGGPEPAVKGQLNTKITRFRELIAKLEEKQQEKVDHRRRIETESDRYVEHFMGVEELEERIGVVEEIWESAPLIPEMEALVQICIQAGKDS